MVRFWKNRYLDIIRFTWLINYFSPLLLFFFYLFIFPSFIPFLTFLFSFFSFRSRFLHWFSFLYLFYFLIHSYQSCLVHILYTIIYVHSKRQLPFAHAQMESIISDIFFFFLHFGIGESQRKHIYNHENRSVWFKICSDAIS